MGVKREMCVARLHRKVQGPSLLALIRADNHPFPRIPSRAADQDGTNRNSLITHQQAKEIIETTFTSSWPCAIVCQV